MKFKLNTLAAALALGLAAQANAAKIDNGALGNGGLFLSVWDSASSYTLNLGYTIDSFASAVAAAGNVNISFAADSTFTNYLSGVADTSALMWNIMATDTAGARRIVTTYTPPTVTPTKTNDVIRTDASKVQTFVNAVNPSLTSSDSATFSSTDAGWAGQTQFGNGTAGNLGAGLNFNTAAHMGDTLSMMTINAAATGVAYSTYNPIKEGATVVTAKFDSANALVISAVPEPESYAMMLAGLGMIGFMARRRLSRV